MNVPTQGRIARDMWNPIKYVKQLLASMEELEEREYRRQLRLVAEAQAKMLAEQGAEREAESKVSPRNGRPKDGVHWHPMPDSPRDSRRT